MHIIESLCTSFKKAAKRAAAQERGGQFELLVSSCLWVLLQNQTAGTALLNNIYQGYRNLFLKYHTWRF